MGYVAYSLSLAYALVFLLVMALSARSRAQNNGLFYMFMFGATVMFGAFLAPFEMHAFDPAYGNASTLEIAATWTLGILGGGSMMILAVIYHRKFERLGHNAVWRTQKRRG